MDCEESAEAAVTDSDVELEVEQGELTSSPQNKTKSQHQTVSG